jgi:hypothetical protein
MLKNCVSDTVHRYFFGALVSSTKLSDNSEKSPRARSDPGNKTGTDNGVFPLRSSAAWCAAEPLEISKAASWRTMSEQRKASCPGGHGSIRLPLS